MKPTKEQADIAVKILGIFEKDHALYKAAIDVIAEYLKEEYPLPNPIIGPFIPFNPGYTCPGCGNYVIGMMHTCHGMTY